MPGECPSRSFQVVGKGRVGPEVVAVFVTKHGGQCDGEGDRKGRSRKTETLEGSRLMEDGLLIRLQEHSLSELILFEVP